MDTLSYSAFRNQLASVLDKVNCDHKTRHDYASKWQASGCDEC